MKVNPDENKQIHVSTSPDLQRTKGPRCNGIFITFLFKFKSVISTEWAARSICFMAGFSFCNITPISAFISPFSTRILFLNLGHQCVFVAQRQQRITGVVNKDATLISSAHSPTYTLQTCEERERERKRPHSYSSSHSQLQNTCSGKENGVYWLQRANICCYSNAGVRRRDV